eukprot:TRINITY_DN2489_c0_g1_i5.p1 TRINITY_DN2489_c0_g1~~TRINITY_DN2489_c0_g1_i5.p1  ORF type:complete len:269 (+),score=52.52 TRINITY_DN2489_c0_g1_i5:35-808(+)
MGFDLDWTFLNNDDVVLLRGIVWTSAILSVIGSTFIITSYLMFRRTRDFSMKLIFYLSCCDLGSSLSFILSITTTTLDDDLCKLQGFGIQFFIIASSLWTASIAHSLHTIVTKPTYRVERNEKYYHAMTWGISLFLSLWLFFTNQYGQTPAWCWIGINHDVSRFVFFYMWLIIIFIFNAVTYVRVVRSIKTTVNALMHGTLGGTRSMNQWSNASLQVSKHVSRYLIVYFICWCFSLINRIQNFIDPTKPIFFLCVRE